MLYFNCPFCIALFNCSLIILSFSFSLIVLYFHTCLIVVFTFNLLLILFFYLLSFEIHSFWSFLVKIFIFQVILNQLSFKFLFNFFVKFFQFIFNFILEDLSFKTLGNLSLSTLLGLDWFIRWSLFCKKIWCILLF